MRDVHGKVAVVTGAASGIGRGMCEAFVDAGMRVVLADVEEQALERTTGPCGRRRGRARGDDRRLEARAGPGSRRRDAAPLRRRARRLQQRRRRHRDHPELERHARRLELGPRREPHGGDLRRAHFPADPDRSRGRRAHRQHRIAGGVGHRRKHAIRGHEVRRGGAVGGGISRAEAGRLPAQYLGPVSGVRRTRTSSTAPATDRRSWPRPRSR